MLTLEEAIKHCEEVAEKKEYIAETVEGFDEYTREECLECASEHRQLAEWLKCLKEIWNSGDCNDCGNRECLYKPKVGHLVRYNCPFYRKEVKADEREQ